MTKRFNIHKTKLNGGFILERLPHLDTRGFFERMFCQNDLDVVLNGKKIVQINHTLTSLKGSLRGMHFQHSPHAETKIVSCLKGEIFDVMIDLRKGSETFLHWHGEILSEKNFKSAFIPEGFAHGFQTLSNDCELLYFHTSAYNPESEDGVNPFDSRVKINWPLKPTNISDKDLNRTHLTEEFQGILV